MTALELKEALGLEALCCPREDKEITGGYCGDLLSFVMGRASAGDAWVTIMTNINTVAVAALTDVGCVILADGSVPEPQVIERARQQEVNLFVSKLPSYEVCAALGKLLS
ncbi:MAG: hypothetical protein IKM39_02060 [Clostridia bacterium]|nr:hypothetical protein [Clostridia bacterium]